MQTISYNKELLTATGEITRLFSNIEIFNLRTEDGKLITNIPKGKASRRPVACLFAQSSRILKSISNPTGKPIEYPLITIEKKDMRCDLNRNTEIHYDMAINTGDYDANTKPPIPVDITFDIHIFAKYPEDIDMIISNFVPWFNQDVYVTTPHPKIKGAVLDHQVVWDGNIHYDWKSTLSPTEPDIIIASTSFTYKTEIFAGVGPVSDDESGIIHRVIFDYSVVGDDKTEPYTEYDKDAAKVHGNMAGGFFALKYSDDFDLYADRIINNTISLDELDYDEFSLVRQNEKFNSAIMEHDMKKLKESVAEGASIFKHSYWPYVFAKKMNYDDMVQYLEELGSKIPEGEHYTYIDKDIKLAELE